MARVEIELYISIDLARPVPRQKNPYGVLDMAGNVWEWTSSLYTGYPYKPDDGREDPAADGRRVLRGGSFVINQDFVRCAYRHNNAPVNRLNYVGFRVLSPGS